MFQTTEINEIYLNKDNCPGFYTHLEISDGVNRCVLTEKYAEEFAERVKNFEVFDDDIWVITFPKCGTTWTQEIVWLLNNNLDYEVEKISTLDERFPFLESGGISRIVDSLGLCKNLNRPRHIKTHLPIFLLPNQLWKVKPKIVYVCRNPKDAAVSYFHHYRHLFGYTGTREEFFKAFLNDKLLHSPMNEQVLEFWKLRNEPNILFLFFEDMKKDLKPELIKLMNFLGKCYSDDQIDKLCQHVSFEAMKSNSSCNKHEIIQKVKSIKNFSSKNEQFSFLREGKVGSNENEMPEYIKRKFENYMNFKGFKDAGFAYKYF